MDMCMAKSSTPPTNTTIDKKCETRGSVYVYVCVGGGGGGCGYRLTFLLLISLEGWAQWLEHGGHSCCEAESIQHSKPLSPQTYTYYIHQVERNVYVYSIIKTVEHIRHGRLNCVLTFSASPAPAVHSALVALECFARLPPVSISLQNTP
jgi:hypothetical protein